MNDKTIIFYEVEYHDGEKVYKGTVEKHHMAEFLSEMESFRTYSNLVITAVYA